MNDILKNIARSLWRYAQPRLPPGVALAVRNRLPPLRSRGQSPNASDVRSFQLSAHCLLEVYWIAAPIGFGPAASFYVQGDEVARFDCFERNPHMHFNLSSPAYADGNGKIPTLRIRFPAAPVEELIERAAFELENNVLSYAIPASHNPRVRASAPSRELVRQAADLLREGMSSLVHRHRNRA